MSPKTSGKENSGTVSALRGGRRRRDVFLRRAGWKGGWPLLTTLKDAIGKSSAVDQVRESGCSVKGGSAIRLGKKRVQSYLLELRGSPGKRGLGSPSSRVEGTSKTIPVQENPSLQRSRGHGSDLRTDCAARYSNRGGGALFLSVLNAKRDDGPLRNFLILETARSGGPPGKEEMGLKETRTSGSFSGNKDE